MNCPKCDADISESFEPDDPSVPINMAAGTAMRATSGLGSTKSLASRWTTMFQ